MEKIEWWVGKLFLKVYHLAMHIRSITTPLSALVSFLVDWISWFLLDSMLQDGPSLAQCFMFASTVPQGDQFGVMPGTCFWISLNAT